jgi:hypothetical protein
MEECMAMMVALSARISIASMKSDRKNRETKFWTSGDAMFLYNTQFPLCRRCFLIILRAAPCRFRVGGVGKVGKVGETLFRPIDAG